MATKTTTTRAWMKKSAWRLALVDSGDDDDSEVDDYDDDDLN